MAPHEKSVLSKKYSSHGSKELNYLVDSLGDIFETRSNQAILLKAQELAIQKTLNSNNHGLTWSDMLIPILKPQAFHEPDLVETFTKLYNSSTRSVMFDDGSRVLFTITLESISAMLLLQTPSKKIDKEGMVARENN
jgi:hypothetical protein